MPSAPSPVLAAPVELVRNPSKITWPDRRREPSGVDAPRLQLTSRTVANLVQMPSPASPVLSAPVELVRNPSKIAWPDRRREPSAVDAPRLQLTPGTVANVGHPASAIVATLASQSRPRLAIPKTAIVVEVPGNTTPDLHMVPVTQLPVLPEARRKDVPIAVIATSRAGGGLKAYGAFKNRMVYTIYIDTAAGRVVLQFAAQNSTGAYAAGLTPPDPLITDMPSAISGPGVVFSGVLDTAGQFQNIRMMAGSAPNQVLEALRRWRFHPVLIGKQPVAVDALIGIGVGVQ